MTASKIEAKARPVTASDRLEFATVYRENIGAVTAFFARRAFDDTLWERLVAEHDADRVTVGRAAHHRTRRGPLLVGGGAAALAGVATAAVLALNAATSAPPAYALTVKADGSVSVTINGLASAIPRLNAEFARRGINETVVPVTASCPAASSGCRRIRRRT